MSRRYVNQIAGVLVGFYVGSQVLKLVRPYWEARGLIPELVTVHSWGLAAVLAVAAGGLVWAFLQ